VNGVSVLAARGASSFLRKDTPPERLVAFGRALVDDDAQAVTRTPLYDVRLASESSGVAGTLGQP
jgi:hypothetical protein